MFGEHKIEIVPKNNQVPTGTVESPIDVTTTYVVKYNGQVLPEAMNKDKALSIPPNTPEDKEALAMIVVPLPSISGNTVPIVKVISPAIGISVLFDGASVTIEVNSLILLQNDTSKWIEHNRYSKRPEFPLFWLKVRAT